jgi:hypothetical protein
MRNNPDDLANQKLEKIREICEINTRKKFWEEIQPEDEFQFIVDLIDEELK